MRRLQEGGQQFYLAGVRFRVFGDPLSNYVRQMVHASMRDLQKLKDRSDPSLETIDYERAPFYKVRSRFGADEIFIYPEVKKGVIKVEREIVTEEEREEREVEYLPTLEAYNKNKEQIGYVICSNLSWNPTELWLTDNVIQWDADADETAVIREDNENVTVDPFMWPVWKGYYYEVDGFTNKPFTGVLQNKDLKGYAGIVKAGSDIKDSSVKLIEIASTFEECVFQLFEFSHLDPTIEANYVEVYNNSWGGDFEQVTLELIADPGTCSGCRMLAAWARRLLIVDYSWYDDRDDYMYMTNTENFEEFHECPWTAYMYNYGSDIGWRKIGANGYYASRNLDWSSIDFSNNGWAYLYGLMDTWYAATIASFEEPNDYVIDYTYDTYLIELYTGGTCGPDGYAALDKSSAHFERNNYVEDPYSFTEPTYSNCKDTSKYAQFVQWWNTNVFQTNESSWYYVDPGSVALPDGQHSYWISWTECEFTDVTKYPYKISIYINNKEFIYKEDEHDEDETYLANDYINTGHIRYYELSESGENFVVLISMLNRKVGWDEGDPQPKWIYFIYDSMSGEMKGLDDQWAYESAETLESIDYWEYHIVPGFTDENGDPVYARGHFRLLERTTSIKYNPVKKTTKFAPIRL